MKFNKILENIFETETINNIKNIYLTLASPIIIHFIQAFDCLEVSVLSRKFPEVAQDTIYYASEELLTDSWLWCLVTEENIQTTSIDYVTSQSFYFQS